jgi:hypothetical protein
MKKVISRTHEDYIAAVYKGRRSPSSGASVVDKGDVSSDLASTLFECKVTGEPGNPKTSTLVRLMEKIADEAWETGKEPALALRFFCPDSLLASQDGWIDLTVRRTKDDVERVLNGD